MMNPGVLAQLQAELGFDEPPAAPTIGSHRRRWLCLYFADLPVDALQLQSRSAAVVVETIKSRITVVGCNTAAIDAGIAAGMTLSSAMALTDALAVHAREVAAEQRSLQQSLRLAWDYSDQIVVLSADALAIEIGGSVRLFGGMDALMNTIRRRFDESGLRYRWSVAPSLQAAYWLSICGKSLPVQSVDELKSVLRTLPLVRLLGDGKLLLRMRRSGILTLGDVMRLPRKDAMRRFGAELFRQLDCALCLHDEVFERYRPAEQFDASHEFYLPTDRLEWILSAAGILLAQFERFLLQRQAAVQQFDCELLHARQRSTVITVGTAQYSNRAGHWLQLLSEHLQVKVLNAPVTALRIRAQQIHVFNSESRDLFELHSRNAQSWSQLLDRLGSRLGHHAIRRYAPYADHRPQRAYCLRDERLRQPAAALLQNEKEASAPRPYWLLTTPQPLRFERESVYWCGQRLCLRGDRERIEQGWWDGEDSRRDYYVAEAAAGTRLWIYRDLNNRQWYLHGLFG